MRFYRLWPVAVGESRYTGEYKASRKWRLPGVHCPACGAIWGGGLVFPCVDLSELPVSKMLGEARLEEDFEAFERLREQVRPVVPTGAPLWPGSSFGPLRGTAQGRFGQLQMQYADSLLIRREALEQLQAEGIRGLTSCRTELRFRQKQAPELLEFQAEPHGRLHPDCIPRDKRTPCARCGRWGFAIPDEPILDKASLPEHLDFFQLSQLSTLMVASERLVEAIHRLGFEEVSIRELPLR